MLHGREICTGALLLFCFFLFFGFFFPSFRLRSLSFLLLSVSCGFEADWSQSQNLGLSVVAVKIAKFSGATFSNIQLDIYTKQTSRDHVDLDQTLHGKNRARNAAGITLLPVAQHRCFLWVIRLRPRCGPHIPTPLLLTPTERLPTSFTLSYPTLCNSIFILIYKFSQA